MNIHFNADLSRDFWHFKAGRWQITFSGRAWADDALGDWDAGDVAFGREGSGERCLRLPFMAAFWGRA